MATVGGLLINLSLNTVGLTAGLAKAEAEMAGFEASITGTTRRAAGGFPIMAAAAATAGLAIAASFVVATKAAIDFEYQMRLIRTQAGASPQELTSATSGILAMAPEVQTGPNELARGMFHVESVGIRGAQAMDLLKTAAEGARVGNADLESVTNALVAAFVSGIGGAQDFSTAMGTLNAIVGVGNIRMQDLADSLSSGILSTAKIFGLSLTDVGAAMATMADQGIPAEEAATRLRITIALIGAPTKIAAHELATIGLSATQLAYDMRKPDGLSVALRDLQAHMTGAGLTAVEQSQVLKTAFGGSRSSAGILTLISSMDLMDAKIKAIKAGAKNFDEMWAEESTTASAHVASFTASVQVFLIKLGDALLPVVMKAADVFGALIRNADIAIPIVLMLAGAVGIMAVNAFVHFAAAAAGIVIQLGRDIIASAQKIGVMAGVTASTEGAAVATEGLSAATAKTTISAASLAASMQAAATTASELAASLQAAVTANAELAGTAAGAAASTGGLAGAEGIAAAAADAMGTSEGAAAIAPAPAREAAVSTPAMVVPNMSTMLCVASMTFGV